MMAAKNAVAVQWSPIPGAMGIGIWPGSRMKSMSPDRAHHPVTSKARRSASSPSKP